jgi:hypothetical protein
LDNESPPAARFSLQSLLMPSGNHIEEVDFVAQFFSRAMAVRIGQSH